MREENDMNKVKERPILFTSDMVRAILDGRKTETRRVLDGNQDINHVSTSFNKMMDYVDGEYSAGFDMADCMQAWFVKSRYGKPGDALYVRETFYHYGYWVKNGKTLTGAQAWTFKPIKSDDGDDVRLFDNQPALVRPNKYRLASWYKRPSIFMPRWASRLLLEVTEVKVERVQEIGVRVRDGGGWAELFAEGIGQSAEWKVQGGLPTPLSLFIELWDSINKKRGYSWESNPWVWVVKFKVIEKRGE